MSADPPQQLRPDTIAEAGDMLRAFHAAARRDLLLIPRGGGTKPPTVHAPSHACLHTCNLRRVVDFSPADMTITVESGMTLCDLDATLSPHGLRLPIDPPPHDGRATVGGALAANDSGPLRLAHGTGREHVIGMYMLLADGAAIKSGGRVVKNVAGYDLHRLFVGSRGTLGLMATVSFKLRPRAEALRLVAMSFADVAAADRHAAALISGVTRPALLEWTTAPLHDGGRLAATAPSAGGVCAYVGFEDDVESAEWQAAQVTREQPGATLLDPAASLSLYQRLRDRAGLHGPFRFAVAVPPERIAAAFQLLAPAGSLQAHAASGFIHGAAADTAADLLAQIVNDHGGWARHWRADQPSILIRRADAVRDKLEHGIKRALDPRGVFASVP